MGGQEDPEYVPDAETVTRTRDELFAYFEGLTQERRSAPRDDLISALATAEPGGEALRLDELLPYYLLLMFAGNDTTRNLVSWAAVTFGEFPDQWEAVRADPDVIPGAVEELVRWNTPVYCMRRTATSDFERHGERVEAGQKVVLWWPSANRDPRAIEEPEVFDVTRSPNKHMSFGFGPHFCIGSHLARLEVSMLLRRMVERGIGIEVTGEPVRLRSNFIRGIKRLPVRVHG
jgi:cytochrome P450